jgi:hypothetical protein
VDLPCRLFKRIEGEFHALKLTAPPPACTRESLAAVARSACRVTSQLPWDNVDFCLIRLLRLKNSGFLIVIAGLDPAIQFHALRLQYCFPRRGRFWTPAQGRGDNLSLWRQELHPGPSPAHAAPGCVNPVA